MYKLKIKKSQVGFCYISDNERTSELITMLSTECFCLLYEWFAWIKHLLRHKGWLSFQPLINRRDQRPSLIQWCQSSCKPRTLQFLCHLPLQPFPEPLNVHLCRQPWSMMPSCASEGMTWPHQNEPDRSTPKAEVHRSAQWVCSSNPAGHPQERCNDDATKIIKDSAHANKGLWLLWSGKGYDWSLKTKRLRKIFNPQAVQIPNKESRSSMIHGLILRPLHSTQTLTDQTGLTHLFCANEASITDHIQVTSTHTHKSITGDMFLYN